MTNTFFTDNFGDTRDRLAIISAFGQVCHQMGDDPCIFHDDTAARLVGLGPDVMRFLVGEDGGFRSGRFYLASRNRFVTESIALWSAAGVRQLVVYSAGLATFSYQETCAGMRVFEIDSPWIQKWKRHRLIDSGITVSSSVRYVSAAGPPTAEQLATAGFDYNEPTMFLWLGSLSMTNPEEIQQTLDRFRGCRFINVVVEYLEPYAEAIARSIDSLGLTPLTSHTSSEITAGFEAWGLRVSDNFAVPELIARYTAKPMDGQIFLPVHLLQMSRH